jgi:dolichol-phosphate mannosyltransferase
MQGNQILVIIPTYNERENIGLLVEEIHRVLSDSDILVVDDSSPDGTGEHVRELCGTINGLHLLTRPKKEGLGRAYVNGFKWALERSYQIIFQMDADFSHDPGDFSALSGRCRQT